MPVYEYECGKCGGRFELTRKFSDPELAVCSLCNANNTVRKVLSPMAFVLKGSGWYASDYASKDRQAGQASEKPAEKPKEEPKPAAGCAAGACAGNCPSKG